MIGVVPLRDALERAAAAGLDLVEISPGAEPPVCKLLDYGKYKYEAQKRAQEAKKKQKVVEIKELKYRPNIGENDYQVKMRSLVKFIGEGDKVKITLRFRGREITHKEIAMKLLDRIVADTAEFTKVELAAKMEGKMMLMVLSPK